MTTRWMPACLFCACVVASSAAQVPPATPPGSIIAHSAAATRVFLGSPSLAILPDGTYVASHDMFGPAALPDEVRVFASRDKGQTWEKLSVVTGQYWSSLFVVDGALYLMGTDRSMGTPVIRRSTDGGATWTTPSDPLTGRFDVSGRYITAPVPVLIERDRVWRAFEVIDGGDLRSLVLSAPVDGDLLDTRNWRATKPLPSDHAWLDGNFLTWEEGSVVATAEREPAVVLRVNTKHGPEKVALVHMLADGRSLSFDPAHDFIDFPGGGKKFTVRFDARSGRYWSLANAVPNADGGANLERVRNTLALTSSPDLRHWSVERVLLQSADAQRHGFQYADWQFDGDDIVAVVRMAFDDGEGGAHSQHDSNYVTFVRVRDFRHAAADKRDGAKPD
ncbi:sialidase family protein [Burkholderia pseudomallei]|uniref:sialidase family protein n=1 Tax=Burkholderia pseudomallei TaxID=28450 RepID=UPI00018A4DB2|nr:sialidase family protein [Burkholderia pseudomallei]AIO94993.1 BNR/Asp-box repeat family protein [Burkholderia pseudomallei 576]AIP48051.1 BNR/Asp-box repeat family protein [Burkholderia pseudomallei MSHR5858]ALB15030.1 glycosyl hydrolase [Burkholderia pseudomallei]EEC36270.1 BNR/Asp-box repeat protein [Burkholderia pseudomallei 576]KGD26422.1 BNR/Asp-box repeat family protein [Burkholderia pseudomallei]